MSGGGGGGSRVSIPADVRKTIQTIKEITGKQHSDEDVYAELKDCAMDPNETARKLLFQGEVYPSQKLISSRRFVEMPKEYYVVFNGRNIGIYDSWLETEVQVSGFSNANYKGYNNWEAAKHAYLKFFNMKELPTTIHLPSRFHPNNEHLKQDDACPSGCSRIIRGLEMELEQTRFQLE